MPIPRETDGIGSPRIRDLDIVRMVAGLVLVLHGQTEGSIDITADL